MRHLAPLLLLAALAHAGCLGESGSDADTAPDADTTTSADADADSSADAASCEGATPGAACTGAAVCDLGQECCCGACHPSTVCSCSGATWSCYATDACFIPQCPDVDADASDGADDQDVADTSGACPAEAPGPSDTCTSDGLQCGFGQECCCGACHPSLSCTCTEGSWACHATDACFIPHCGDVGSGACDGARDALAATLYAKPQAFTVVVRLDHDALAIKGYAVVAGSYAAVDEATARAAAEAATGYGAGATLLSGPDPADAWVFYESPGDFGGVGAVSDHTGLAVFGGGIVWDGTGDITWPTAWSPAGDLGGGCPAVSGGLGSTRGFDLVTGAPLAASHVDAAIAVVADTALPAAVWQGGYAFDAVVLRYPRSVGVFNPATAEWIVLVSGGWLE